jgi:thermitase
MRKGRVLAAAAAVAISLGVAQSANAADYESGQVIVKPNLSGVGSALQQVDGVGATVVSVKGSVPAAVKSIQSSGLVTYAEPNYILKATATPNDALFGQLYGMQKISAPAGWDAAGLGSFPSTGGVKVGIVDTGIDQNHEDLRGKTVACAQSRGLGGVLSGSIQTGSCADDNDHGSHVAGTLAGNANNSVGVAGVAFNSPLVICKALGGPLGSGSTADVANCITWVKDQGAKVVSMSLGGGDSTTLHNAVNYVWSGGGANGAVVIAAAGNDGDSTVNYPAGYAEAVSVAATDQNDARASFSNANADVEIAAPGVNVLSTYNDGSYTTLSGTSMATPHVAGVAAIIWGKNPGSTASAVRSKLDASVDDLGAAGRDPSFGFGRVNLLKAAT